MRDPGSEQVSAGAGVDGLGKRAYPPAPAPRAGRRAAPLDPGNEIQRTDKS